ncbi:hypothetical protein [Pseudaestuariivita atlantica]|uniref:Cation/multidrug efflux pump n=1 Tax=Pseudaestuariivita atlantica TaxID=1317121 RepID=A0A0L1JQ26_9RHOB|nr:hypothetical protein [Pseudaestuariivita atlantica]KNG93841.1 hypothetical protein ATO11_11785 [Pseudaestuariivita atlantica]
MFFGLLRLLVIGFVFLTIIYIILSLWSRSVRRKKLEAEWEGEAMTGDRDQWVRNGLEEYDGSVRRKLILGVYIIPVIVVSVIVYLTNFA